MRHSAIRSSLLPGMLCIAPMVLGGVSAGAQVANGSITGKLADSTGAVIPEADVVLTKTETGVSAHSKANADGIYTFPALQTGTYRLQVAQAGFKKAEATVALAVGQNATLDLTLEVGSTGETVTVAAGTTDQLNTDNSTLSYTVGARQVSELPLNGRNPYALAQLSPGINPGGSFGTGVSTTRGALVAAATNNFESNGGAGGNNEILLDGIAITLCCQGQPALTPTAEVVDQFKVITSNPGAQFGRSSGGFLNIVTKTGTKDLHGDVYDFLRNDKLDAANFFQKRSGIFPLPTHHDFRFPHRYNQFGAFVGGPVFIPKLYDGRQKTFFTFGYEGQRNLTYAAQTTTVPTVLMRQGILTEYTGGTVYSPYSTRLIGNTYTRTPLAAGCSGATCFGAGQGVANINPVSAKLLALYPLPTTTGLTNNYSYAQGLTDRDDQFNFRVDENFSSKNRLFVRGTRGSNTHHENDLFNQATGPNSINQNILGYLFAAGDSWTISPTMLLQTTYGFAAQRNLQLPGNYGFDASQFGFSSNFLTEQQTVGFPVISVSGFAQLGNAVNSNQWNHYTHFLEPILVWQLGKHNLTMGYDGRLILENERSFTNPLGSLSFDSTLTRGPNAANGASSTGAQFDSIAAFLIGTPTSTNLTRQATLAMHQWYHALFVQDDWRLLNKLTLNLGVRYDMDRAMRERHNNWAALDLTAANPLSTPVLPLQGGAQYVGANGNPTGFWEDYNKVGPRVGLSWNPYANTVVRAGYDILYLPTSQRIYGASTLGYAQNTQQTYTYTQVPTTLIDNPLPSGVALPAGPTAGVQVGTGTSVAGLLYHNPQPYYSQWNAGIEQEFAKGVVLHLNYAGSKGTHLPITYRPNDLQPQYWGAVGDPGGVQAAYLTAAVTNPLYGKSGVSGTLATPTVQRQQLLAAYPQYGPNTGLSNGSLSVIQDDIGSTTYHAFQAFLTVQRSSNLSAIVSYTWSKLIGNTTDVTVGSFNPTGQPGVQNFYRYDLERSLLPSDIPQRIVGNLTYTLPFGHGQRFGGGVPGWTNQVIGGWKLNSIDYVQSGFPLGITQANGPAYSGSRPSFVAGVNPLTTGSTHQRLGGGAGVGQTQSYFNPAAFRLSQAFELGNVPRVSGQLRGPLSFQDDVSAIKDFPIHEAVALQFRLEAFNVLNKVQFGLPNQQFNSATFGQITSQYNLPRNVQVALKLMF